MKSLIQSLPLLAYLILSVSAFGGGEVVGGQPEHQPPEGWTAGKIVPVSNVSISLMRGCGQPNPSGCPDNTEVTFTVEMGGTCHSYSVKPQFNSGSTTLTILDSAMENCTRPEKLDYEASVTFEGNLGSQPVMVGNPVYIKTSYRP